MELSIVTTMYDSAPYLAEFYDRMSAAARQITDDYELILVNDGSPDHSLEIALSLYERDERVQIIDLSRNFGQHKAMMTGLVHARGQLVFLIDCDLEASPEILLKFYDELRCSKVDVVYGVQDVRRDRLVDQLGAQIFYTVFNWLSADRLPVNLVTTRLMSQRYVAALVAHQEREMIIGGLYVITGFKQTPIVVAKTCKGKSAYDLGRKIAILVNAITSFSNRPLVLVFYLGSAISFLAGIGALYLLVRRLFFGVLLAGWPSLMVSIWLLGGLMIFCVGIIGVYLSKVFVESKQRPYTIVRQYYGRAARE